MTLVHALFSHFKSILRWKGNGSLYGEHPFYWYIVAGFPAITGALLVAFSLYGNDPRMFASGNTGATKLHAALIC